MLNLVGASTVEEIVKLSEQLDFNYEKMHLKATLNVDEQTEIIIDNVSILDNYIDYIIDNCTVMYTWTSSEKEKYRYQPKKFCYDTYKCCELWFLLLKINYMVSVTDFDRDTVRIFNNNIFKTINEILILEEERYNENLEKNS